MEPLLIKSFQEAVGGFCLLWGSVVFRLALLFLLSAVFLFIFSLGLSLVSEALLGPQNGSLYVFATDLKWVSLLFTL